MTPLSNQAYRRLLRYLRPYVFPYVALAVATMLTLSATNGAVPFLAKNFINQLAKLRNLSQLHLLSLELLALFVIRAVANFGNNYLTEYIGQKVVLDLRAQLHRRLQQMSLAFFNRTPTGVLMTRILSDITLVAGATTDGIFSLIGDTATLLALLGAAIYIDWSLALIAAVVFPAAVLPLTQFSKRMRKMSRRSQQQLGGLAALLQETIQGNRVVKAFGMEDYECRRFESESRRLFRIYMRVSAIKAFSTPMIEVMAAVGVVAVLWFGAVSVLNGSRTPGSFGAFFAAMLLVYEPFKRLTRTNNSIQQGIAAAERVFEVLDEPSEVAEDANPVPLPPGPHSIALEQVGFRYAEQWTLRQIDLVLRPGSIVALVGMSGGGKSTLADLILRFYDPQEGRVTLNGVDIRRLRIADLRGQIGLVTQHTFLFNDTVRANIAYGNIGQNHEALVEAARMANAHNFISRLPKGYDTVIGEMGVRLSGGERQRIAIARALLKNAPILVLDEATSALDSESERLVQEALDRLMENRTTLVIAHRLSTVRRADQIVVITRGRITESGSHAELMALGGEYRSLYDLQLHALETDPSSQVA